MSDPIRGFFIECSACKAVSPETRSTVNPPAGWTQVVEATKGGGSTTTFKCPTCSEGAKP